MTAEAGSRTAAVPGAETDADTDPCAGTEQTIAALYTAELPRLTRFFRGRTGQSDEAADLAQDTFLRLLRVSPAAIRTPQAYLRRIAGNLLRDRAASAAARLARLQLPVEQGHDVADAADPHRILEARGELEHYRRVLIRLKPKTLEIFLLHRVDGLTYSEIGARLGLSEGGVKRHMVKAIAHIARARRPQ